MTNLGQEVVIDASALLPLFLPETNSQDTVDLFEQFELGNLREIHAPRLLMYECAHVLLRHVRRQQLSTQDAVQIYRTIDELRLTLYDTPALSRSEFETAAKFTIGGYDAVYVALAARLSLPLVSNDKGLLANSKGLHNVLSPTDATVEAKAGRLRRTT